MFVDNCFEEMMEGYRMSTRRIYLEGLKETDENADKKIFSSDQIQDSQYLMVPYYSYNK